MNEQVTSPGGNGPSGDCTPLPPNLLGDVERVRGIPIIERILDVCCRVGGMRFAAVARVGERRWVACSVADRLEFGLRPGGELELETTLCHEVVGNDTEIFIDDAASDARYADHPCPRHYGFRSYVSVPIRLSDGTPFGTLCALDPEPSRVRERGVPELFRLFADLIASRVESDLRVERSETALADERERSRLHEELIAVLGHDLRNPLASIDANAQLIDAIATDESTREPANTILRSVHRMAELIANLLDFARGRLGDGLELERRASDGLDDQLLQVIDELRVAHPDHRIDTRIDVDDAFLCDPDRVAQLLSNLVGNALLHGSAEQPIEIDARSDAESFRLSVSNGGEPIPEPVRAQLFQPFRRSNGVDSDRGALAGLGLGLHIAHEIALAHGGTLSVDSDERRTRFLFSMPIESA